MFYKKSWLLATINKEHLINGKMIQVKLTPASRGKIPNTSFDTLDKIPTRHFTDWLNLPDDKDKIVPKIKKFVQERKGSWDRVLCLGMGGSALGIVTLQKAFYPFDDRLKVLDNLDSNTIYHELSILNPERTLVLVISKSGTTLETMTQFSIFKEKYSEKQFKKNFIFLTDPNTGKLRELITGYQTCPPWRETGKPLSTETTAKVEDEQLTSFQIPPQVGGRFSVLSAVGLLPFALLGGDIDSLLKGAASMKKRCLEKSLNNPALQLASITHQLNKPLVTMLIYDDQLSALGAWYQQLLAESIGKSKKVGFTPLPLRGASDQHSVLQLLQDGPNDKLNIFLEVINPFIDVLVPRTSKKAPRLTVHNILRAECNATEQALREDGRPTIMIEIPETTPHTLGELFMLFQMQIAILGELYGIDAYNQPGVEKSKKIARELLKNS